MKGVFQGEFQHGLDAKGRVILPAKIREELGAHFVLTKGLDGCLYIFTPDSWREFSAKLQELPTSSPQTRRLLRHFIGSAVECETDKQGRFLIPPVLRSFAGINKEATILGVTSKIEVWATEKYDSYQNEGEESIEDIAGSLVF